MKIKVGIVGATGYTGAELLRLLAQHPQVQIHALTSRAEAGVLASQLFPHLRGYVDLPFRAPAEAPLLECDVVFFATPHGVAMAQAPALLAAGVRVIDLGADFRLKDAAQFSAWYGLEHTAPKELAMAVYGLVEVNAEQIASARLVALPGCYPTAVQLGFAPLLAADLIQPQGLIASCASGVSGAGRKAEIAYLHAEVTESFRAYGVSRHRHHPEIVQGLSAIAASPIELIFTPHLVPMMRGIHATLYARLKQTQALTQVQACFEHYYRQRRACPFIDLLPINSHPETRSVRHSNWVRIALHQPSPEQLVILVVEDNLIKGAAGQGVQCLNLMFDWDESLGLLHIPT